MKLKKFDEMNEVKSNESYFITEIESTDVSIFDFGNIEYEDMEIKECKIHWDYELIAKKFGIDSIIPSIKKVNLSIDFITWEDDDESTENVEYTFDIMNSNIETENIKDNCTIPYYPIEVEIETLNPDKNPDIKILF